MGYQPQQEDIQLLKQKIKTIYTKVQLLNSFFKPISELQGEITQGNITIDAQSDIRRTCSMVVHVKNNAYIFNEDSYIWMDKYVRIFIGFKSTRTQSIVWYNVGIYIFDSSQYVYNETTKSLTLSCSDLVTKLDGTHGGVVNALTTTIPQGSIIRSAMIDSVSQLGGIKNYIVDEMGEYYNTASNNKIPYDLEFSTGVTVYEIVKELRDLYPAWETFFDVEGTFICQMIPTCENDDIILDSSILKDLVIDENINIDHTLIKNVTQVYGQIIDADRYTDICTNTSNQYNVTFSDFELITGIIIAIKVNIANLANMKLKVNSLTAYPITDTSGTVLTSKTLKANTVYCFKYYNSQWQLLGQYQVSGIYKNENEDSQFSIQKIGERLQVLSGGNYDNIYSDTVAQQTAEYENWKSSRLTDTITLTTLLIPWLDVNQKVEYTTLSTNETNQYITKTITFDFTSGIQTITMCRFYPLYPNIIT